MNLINLLLLVSAAALEPPCITCKHFINVGNTHYSRCKMFPVLYKKDEVNDYGHYAQNDYYYCSTARTFASMCGNGKYYEHTEENMVTYTKRSK
jgi:hypothetical protein